MVNGVKEVCMKAIGVRLSKPRWEWLSIHLNGQYLISPGWSLLRGTDTNTILIIAIITYENVKTEQKQIHVQF
jgi:hypothetical protein